MMFRFLSFLFLLSWNPFSFPSLITASGVLYVWSGQNPQKGPNAADFIAVVDYDPKSSTYGKIISTVSLPNNISTVKVTGNEPHHVGLSSNKQYFVTGGLLSFLQGSDQVFIWKVNNKNPRQAPTYLYSVAPPGGCTDDFLPWDTNSFLFTQMCNSAAVSPGHLVYLNIDTRSVRSLTQSLTNQSLKPFNPHGFDVTADKKTVLVANYIVPGTLTGDSVDGIVFRNFVSQFEITKGNLSGLFPIPTPGGPVAKLTNSYNVAETRTIVGTGRGFMTYKSIPGDPLNRGYTCGTNDNYLYLVTPGQGAQKVYDLITITADKALHLSSGIFTIPRRNRLIGTFQMRYIFLFDITDPTKPKILQTFDFCLDPSLSTYQFSIYGKSASDLTTYSKYCQENNHLVGSHFLEVIDTKFVVVNYFLSFALAQFGGTRTVHSFNFLDKTLSKFKIDLNFNPNPQFHALMASAHAFSFLPTKPVQAGGKNKAAATPIPTKNKNKKNKNKKHGKKSGPKNKGKKSDPKKQKGKKANKKNQKKNKGNKNQKKGK